MLGGARGGTPPTNWLVYAYRAWSTDVEEFDENQSCDETADVCCVSDAALL